MRARIEGRFFWLSARAQHSAVSMVSAGRNTRRFGHLRQHDAAHGRHAGRQAQSVARLLWRDPVGDAELRAVTPRQKTGAAGAAHRRDRERVEALRFHRIEQWRDKLLSEGAEAVTRLKTEFPNIDDVAVRSLTERARKEQQTSSQKITPAGRELFRLLRESM